MKTDKYHKQVGVGLRSPHVDYFISNKPPLSWLEIHSENYFEPYSPARKKLYQLRGDYQISCHGIGLSLGSVEPINTQHLKKLKMLVDEVEPFLISDHLSWSHHGGHYFNDLLPLPYTEEALDVFCRNVNHVQEYLKRPILIENPSSYIKFDHSTIEEWEFLSQVQKRTDCRLLLDLNNIHVSAFNHGFNCQTYIEGIPTDKVDEIHLAGFTIKQLEQGEIWIDTHSQPVCDDVWFLYEYWLSHHGPRHTLIEWDLDIPEPEVLLGECQKASQRLIPFSTLKGKKAS
ncbi:DUF692 domain-containing protein [Vibrio sp.]|uniref:MNIO family bufferin maturase n=1 Tax=Vibrio sp. TaxID=678 RepID=UPI00311E52C6